MSGFVASRPILAPQWQWLQVILSDGFEIFNKQGYPDEALVSETGRYYPNK